MDLITPYCTTFLRIRSMGEKHARLTQFVEHAMEDLPELLNEAFVVVFLHNVPWVVFYFISICRLVFDRVKSEAIVARQVGMEI